MKVCGTCKVSKPFKDFSGNGKTPKGTVKYKPDCVSCTLTAKLERFEKIVLTYYGEYRCSKCGYSKCKQAIEFHHINPSTKDGNISRMRNSSEETLIKEFKKCVMLCANCHRELHNGCA